MMFGVAGSTASDEDPTPSRDNVFAHVFPPSVDLNTPRDEPEDTWPGVATRTTSGFFGSTTMAATMWVSARPTFVHVTPLSVDFQTPLPAQVPSPAPTYTMSGSESPPVTAPIAASRTASVIGLQVCPASSVFHTPPPAMPASQAFAS